MSLSKPKFQDHYKFLIDNDCFYGYFIRVRKRNYEFVIFVTYLYFGFILIYKQFYLYIVLQTTFLKTKIESQISHASEY